MTSTSLGSRPRSTGLIVSTMSRVAVGQAGDALPDASHAFVGVDLNYGGLIAAEDYFLDFLGVRHADRRAGSFHGFLRPLNDQADRFYVRDSHFSSLTLPSSAI